jgi:hypothetical protein
MIKATLALAAGLLAAFPAMATQITFTISAYGTGTLGTSTTFTDQLITFTQVTDTTAITTCSGYPCAPVVTTNTVNITGVGTETLNASLGTYFFDNAINVAGITSASGQPSSV